MIPKCWINRVIPCDITPADHRCVQRGQHIWNMKLPGFIGLSLYFSVYSLLWRNANVILSSVFYVANPRSHVDSNYTKGTRRFREGSKKTRPFREGVWEKNGKSVSCLQGCRICCSVAALLTGTFLFCQALLIIGGTVAGGTVAGGTATVAGGTCFVT